MTTTSPAPRSTRPAPIAPAPEVPDAPAQRPAAHRVDEKPRRVYAALVGTAAVLVMLQGLWAGMFMSRPGTDPQQTPWLEVHSWGGKFAILFAGLATLWAFAKLRGRRDLVLGTAAFTVVLVLESYVGGLIVDEGKDVMAAVHVPLAMALMGLAVWLPLRARAGRVGRRV